MSIKNLLFLVFACAAPLFSFSQGPNYTELANLSTRAEADYKTDKYGKVSGGIMSYHSNGLVEEKGVLLDGKRQGLWVKHAVNGTKISEAHYNKGIKTGTWKIWDASGTLKMVMHYRNGERTGRWEIFDNSGELIRWKEY